MKRTSFRRAVAPAVALVALSVSLTACGGDSGAAGDVTGSVVVDGSSTVEPMSKAAAELLKRDGSQIKVSVAAAGTGGGFEKFCQGQTDISDASRPIKTDEATEDPACKKAGIEYTELQVATDALTIVVHKDLAVDCLTVDQIAKLFGPTSKVKNWKQLDPSFPDQEIKFFFPGTDSGTYDYMAADVFDNESEKLRSDVESNEDDNVLVSGVAGTKGAVGFFGYTYYEQNTDKLKALEIAGESGDCVAPSAESAQSGAYTPLARPLFIYVSNEKYQKNEAVKAYVDFYVENLSEIAEAGKFIPLSDELYGETKQALAGLSG